MSKRKAMFFKKRVANYSSFTLASVNSSSIAGTIITPKGIYITDDGTKIFAQESGSDDGVFRFDMSTAFDITTETFTNEKTKLTGVGTPSSCFFKPDGTKYFVVQSQVIYQATLSTPFDTSTQGTVTNYTFTSTSSGVWIRFNDDGTKLYHRGLNVRFGIVEVILSTPYDITSATSEILYLPPTDTLEFDSIDFVNEGNDILIWDNVIQEADLINLSSPYDVSTMSDSVHNQTTGLTILTAGSTTTVSYTDDTNIYVLNSGSSKIIYQFSTSFI